MMRAAAPAWRRRIQSVRMEAEPPVAWSPSSGSMYFRMLGGARLHGDLVQPDLQFLGDQHGGGGVDALPYFGVRQDEGGGAVAGRCAGTRSG